jgi:hypothetical protein
MSSPNSIFGLGPGWKFEIAGGERVVSVDAFARILSNSDVVALGRINEIVEESRPYAQGGCSATNLFAAGWSVSIAVDEVLLGIVADSSISISTGWRFHYPDAVPGSRVILVASRECFDNWHLFGMPWVIRDDSVVLWPLNRDESDAPIVLGKVLKSLRKLEPHHPTRAIMGSKALAIVRVDGTKATRPLRMDCAFIRWAYGHTEGLVPPTTVDLDIPKDCHPEIGIGTELLIPVRAGRANSPLLLRGCADGLVIRRGFVRGLGVRIDDLPSVLAMAPSGITVRRVRGRP